MLPHLVYIFFTFAFGGCVGSFINVVVWRLPRGESLATPPSRCPVCEHRLSWRDNIPVFGWLFLRGRCRYCFNPISPMYPVTEFLTGAIFVFYYALFFIAQIGPCSNIGQQQLIFVRHWPIYALYMLTLSSLLAASLIDLRHFFIPLGIPILMGVAGLSYHTLYGAGPAGDAPGALTVATEGVGGAFALGGAVGLCLSLVLLHRGLLSRSFAMGYPLLEIDKLDEHEQSKPGWLARILERAADRFRRKLTAEDNATMQRFWRAAEVRERALVEEFNAKQAEIAKHQPPPVAEMTKSQIRAEMRHEMLFLIVPLCAASVAFFVIREIPAANNAWKFLMSQRWANGLAASVLGALVGGLVVWITRIVGTLVAGREAMGMGDVHLMWGVGAVIGAGAATCAFFIGPFFGLAIALYMWLTSTRRELPFGPYLSLGTAAVMVIYCPLARYLTPGLTGFAIAVREMLGK